VGTTGSYLIALAYVYGMNATYFNLREQQYGIPFYKDDNEIGLVLDDGSLVYEPKENLRYATGPAGGVRRALWRAATTGYPDTAEAAQHYAKTLAFWIKKASEAGKTCYTCDKFKSFDQFPRNVDAPDGLRNICKTCYAAVNAERYKARKARD